MYLMPQNRTLKNGKNDKFYVIYFFTTIRKSTVNTKQENPKKSMPRSNQTDKN